MSPSPRRTASRHADQRSGSLRPSALEASAGALLSVALLLGGAGNSYPIIGGILEGLSLVLIVQIGMSGRLAIIPRGTMLPWAIGLLTLAVPLAQLVPIPPAVCSRLPGHALPTTILTATGVPIGWRPLSLDPALTGATTLELLPGLALFWAALHLDGRGRLRLLSIAVSAAIASALLGAAQKSGGGDSPLILFATGDRSNAAGLFVNRNHEACFLLAAMPQLGAVMRLSPMVQRIGRIERTGIFVTLLGLLAAGAIATSSRMGLLLLLPAMLAALAIGFGAQRRRAYGLGALLLAAFAAVVASLSSAFGVAVARFGVEEDSRSLFWAATREAIVRFWPTGSGVGTFRRVYPTVEDLATLEAYFPYNAHDDYLELLLEGGAPVLLLLIAAAGFLAMALVRLLRRGRSDGMIAGLAAWCSLVLILLHSIVDYPLRMMSIMALFGMLAGIVARTAASSVEMSRSTAGRVDTRRAVATSIVVLPIALFGFYRVVTSAGAQSALLSSDFERAFALAPNWSDASATLAQKRLREKRVADAAGLATLATASSPLDPQGPTALAMIDQAQDRAAAAEPIFDVLAQLGWRHAPAQYLLAFHAADRGDLAGAMPRVDSLLRQSLYKPQFYPFLRAATAYPDGLSALVRQLAFAPKWRADYLGNLADLQPADFAGHEKLLTALAHSAGSTTTAEVNAYLRRVARDGDYRAAAAASDRLLGQDRDGNLVRDGSFRGFSDRPADAGPFDWQSANPSGIVLDAQRDGLHIGATENAGGAMIRQIVTVPPGAYRLAWKVMPAGGAERRLRWSVRCLGGSYLPTAQYGGSDPATATAFVVPASGCPAQQIELALDPANDLTDLMLSKVRLAAD